MSGASQASPHRILLVETNDDGTVGGSYQCLYDLARGLDSARYAPVVLFHHENRFAQDLRHAGIPVHIWEIAPGRGLTPGSGSARSAAGST